MTKSAKHLRRRIEAAIERLEKLHGHRSRFSDAWAYFLEGREILHFHDDGEKEAARPGEALPPGGPSVEIDLRLTREVIRAERERLAADPRVGLGRRERDWITLRFGTIADVPFVVELVRLAIRANRRSRTAPGPGRYSSSVIPS